jgi:DNA-binding NtrC family response regulator
MDVTNVMVVDDEQIVCDRVREHLEGQGFEVDTFTESSAALRALDAKRYHVVVTDLKMA